MKASRKNRTRGSATELKGHLKQKTGRLLGNRRLEAEGTVERGAGKLRRKIGELQKVGGD